MSQNGKGSRQRPKSVDYNTWSKNWDNIFKSQQNKDQGKKSNERRRKNTDKN